MKTIIFLAFIFSLSANAESFYRCRSACVAVTPRGQFIYLGTLVKESIDKTAFENLWRQCRYNAKKEGYSADFASLFIINRNSLGIGYTTATFNSACGLISEEDEAEILYYYGDDLIGG